MKDTEILRDLGSFNDIDSFKDKDSFFLEVEGSIILRTFTKKECQIVADNLINAVNNTRHRLSEVLLFIQYSNSDVFEDIDGCNPRILDYVQLCMRRGNTFVSVT